MSVEEHEAAHAAACVWLRIGVEAVRIEPGSVLPGEDLGWCRAPLAVDEIGMSRLIVALIGYLAEDHPGWPPPYEEARGEPLEALATIIRVAGIDERAYDRAVELARDLLADPDFVRLRDTITRALIACPYLDADAIHDLSAVASTPYEGEPACST